MTTVLDATLARIDPAPAADAAVDGGADALASLGLWWQRVGSGGHPTPAWAVASGGINDGIATADRAVDAGGTLLIPRAQDDADILAARSDTALSRDADLPARALIAILSHRDAAAVLPQDGLTDAEWMQRCAALRDRIAVLVELRGDIPALLAACGDDALASCAGMLLGSAARRTPCLIDGIRELASALAADRLAPAAASWWRAASDGMDPAWRIAVERIDLDPGLPLGIAPRDAVASRATLALLEVALARD